MYLTWRGIVWGHGPESACSLKLVMVCDDVVVGTICNLLNKVNYPCGEYNLMMYFMLGYELCFP